MFLLGGFLHAIGLILSAAHCGAADRVVHIAPTEATLYVASGNGSGNPTWSPKGDWIGASSSFPWRRTEAGHRPLLLLIQRLGFPYAPAHRRGLEGWCKLVLLNPR